MSLHLGILYHWSPKRHRTEILRHGLLAMEPARLHGDNPPTWAYVCLGTTPSSAWGLILQPEGEDMGWDLWQVAVADGDPLDIRGEFSPFVREVRVLRSLPADRVWWAAERAGQFAHELIDEPAPPAPKLPKSTRRAKP